MDCQCGHRYITGAGPGHAQVVIHWRLLDMTHTTFHWILIITTKLVLFSEFDLTVLSDISISKANLFQTKSLPTKFRAFSNFMSHAKARSTDNLRSERKLSLYSVLLRAAGRQRLCKANSNHQPGLPGKHHPYQRSSHSTQRRSPQRERWWYR